MKQLKWYFKNGTKYNTYSVLYEDDKFMLVRNDDHDEKEFNGKYGAYSFGTKDCFNSLYGSPVDWSCLHKEKAIEVLKGIIGVEQQYLPTLGEIAEKNIIRWQGMINVLEKEIA